uniref:Alpha-2-macroglobulin RAP C-terminal domain-containing protein n=1 Tax=Arion vulgaris TaxID=1028688 RepID=A0A0B6ZL33_9EUPU
MHCPGSILNVFVLSITLIFCLDICTCSKYSKHTNLETQEDDKDLDFENQEKPFRMQKVNLLWGKGKKVLSGVKLADLYADLKVHDKHEAFLKKMRAEDSDTDGAMEAKVLTNYRRILTYYGLDDTYMSNEIPTEESEKNNVHFQDTKLQTMWKKAEQAGFSDTDLKMLREEFWHQQMKINEYDFVHREMDKLEDPDDNKLDFEYEKLNRYPKEAEDKHAAVKKDKRDIKEGYMNLEHLISSMPASEPTFKDSRVHKLWAIAKKTNWTEEQLNGFREELLHFEHRLKKQSYYQQQLELSARALEDKGDDVTIPDKHKHLEERNNNLGHKIKKLHSDFKTRLDKALRHSEL